MGVEVLQGFCPHCGRPARGCGGTACWRCMKFRQRHGVYPSSPAAPRLNAAQRLKEAAIAYADAEDDGDYSMAESDLEKAALSLAGSQGWRAPRKVRHPTAKVSRVTKRAERKPGPTQVPFPW